MEQKTVMVEGMCPKCGYDSGFKRDFTCTYVEFYDPMTEYTCPKCDKYETNNLRDFMEA